MIIELDYTKVMLRKKKIVKLTAKTRTQLRLRGTNSSESFMIESDISETRSYLTTKWKYYLWHPKQKISENTP